jgi:hypothetical protein
MTRWTHAMCEDCWAREYQEQIPVRVNTGTPMRCCYCGEHTTSGIYVRDDPQETACAGVHDGEA